MIMVFYHLSHCGMSHIKGLTKYIKVNVVGKEDCFHKHFDKFQSSCLISEANRVRFVYWRSSSIRSVPPQKPKHITSILIVPADKHENT